MGLTLDGLSAKEPVRGAVNDDQRIMTGTLDMIQEFKMITTGQPAEYGHTGGGVRSAIYKSGTNEFHRRGSLPERLARPPSILRPARALRHRPALQSLELSRNVGHGRRAGGDPEGLQRPQQDVLLLRLPAPPREGLRNRHHQRPQRRHVQRRLLVRRPRLPALRSIHDAARRNAMDARYTWSKTIRRWHTIMVCRLDW